MLEKSQCLLSTREELGKFKASQVPLDDSNSIFLYSIGVAVPLGQLENELFELDEDELSPVSEYFSPVEDEPATAIVEQLQRQVTAVPLFASIHSLREISQSSSSATAQTAAIEQSSFTPEGSVASLVTSSKRSRKCPSCKNCRSVECTGNNTILFCHV